jgi:serine/threonine protein kinase
MNPDAVTIARELAGQAPSEWYAYFERHRVADPIRAEVESILRAGGTIAEDEPTTRYAVSEQHKLTVIGRYQVVRFLGRGGMGDVYLARDPVLDRNLAIKLVGSELDDAAARKRLIREARAAGGLRHVNIVTIFDAGEHEGRSYIAMEYVPGETLASLIRHRAALPLARRLELIEHACAGLAHAHHAGVVHLDIKPDNLIVDEAGVVKVLDFGVARVLQGETIATQLVGGTLRYMSPEQLEGGDLDYRSDIFSLGCSLFELIAYVPAYTGSTNEIVTKIVNGPVPQLSDVVSNVDPRLAAIVSRAMSLRPADRYQDAEDLRLELARLRGGMSTEDARRTGLSAVDEDGTRPVISTPRPPSHQPPQARGNSSPRRVPVLALSAAAALAIGAALWIWNARSPLPNPLDEASQTASIQPESAPASPPEPIGTTADEVWRRLAAGDRRGVVQRLGPAANGTGASNTKLSEEVLDVVRTSALRARASAAATSGPPSPSYRSAEERLARANQLASQGRILEALEAFWQSSDLYVNAGNQLVRSGPDAATPDRGLGTAAADRESVSSVQPPPTPPRASSDIPSFTPPQSSVLPGRAGASESPLIGEASPLPPPANEVKPSPPSRPVLTTPTTETDAEAVLNTLRRYHAAYQALDVSRIVEVFPSLGREQVEQLRRTFAGMTAYAVEMRNPRVNVQGDTATAHATVARRMTPRVGSEISNEVETEFRLRRGGSGWAIVAVTASGP